MQARIVTTSYNIKFNKIHIHRLHSTHTHIHRHVCSMHTSIPASQQEMGVRLGGGGRGGDREQKQKKNAFKKVSCFNLEVNEQLFVCKLFN